MATCKHCGQEVQLLTVAQVAQRLSCSRQHVYDEIGRGKFREVVDIGGGARANTRIPEPVLAEYITANTRKVGAA